MRDTPSQLRREVVVRHLIERTFGQHHFHRQLNSSLQVFRNSLDSSPVRSSRDPRGILLPAAHAARSIVRLMPTPRCLWKSCCSPEPEFTGPQLATASPRVEFPVDAGAVVSRFRDRDTGPAAGLHRGKWFCRNCEFLFRPTLSAVQCPALIRRPAGTMKRSASSNSHFTARAMTAAGTAPSSIRASLLSRRPVMIGWP